MEPGPAANAAVEAVSATAPDATGVIRDVLDSPAAPGSRARLLVEHPGAAQPADYSIVHLTAETVVLLSGAGGRLRAGGVEDLRPGTTLRVWTTGVELRSYPRQVFAIRIEATL
jgi:hypothetical protein